MAIDYTDELEAGWVIFPLHPINRTAAGVSCACGDPECKVAGKHPKASNWQKTQPYDEAQLAYLEDFDDEFFGNQLIDNHGIVVSSSGLIIVDVDGRNGGFESAESLTHIREQAKYIVRTGSGNGEHWYFSVPESWKGKSLSGTLKDFPGIDFKSTGFVVGAGCEHASGHRYEAEKGSPAEVGDAPDDLLKLLDRPERQRFTYEGVTTDYTVNDLRSMLDCIPNPDRDYEMYIRIGMALHDATGGGSDGLDMWHGWASKSSLYDAESTDKKWHSFGKSTNRATVGTLITWAREQGWQSPVTFVDNTNWGDDKLPSDEQKPQSAKYNLLNPPGLVGEICMWINSRCAFPREQLAVAAALQIVSNSAGLNYLVAGRNTSLNLITFAIAGSRSGKGAIKDCINEANRALGFSPAEHGKFKSSQELVRNAIEHQAIFYTYDEFGEQLKKLGGAAKSGAHYLEDLTAELMAIYSVPTGVHSVSGDVKREIIERMDRAVAAAIKRANLDDDEDPLEYARENPGSPLAAAIENRNRAEYGIVEPYLTFFGISEPVSFHEAINNHRSLLTGGFLGRSLIFEELETVPEEKDPDDVYHGPMPDHVLMRLMSLSNGGSASTNKAGRIQRNGEWRYIQWSAEAKNILIGVRQYWREVALHERDSGTGLESQALGATELAIKVAGILGADKGQISGEDMGWAHELVKRVTHMKINKAKSDDSLGSTIAAEKGNGLLLAIMTAVENADKEMTLGVLKQRVPNGRKMGDGPIQAALDHLVGLGRLKVEQRKGGNGRVFCYYSLAK